MGKNDLKRSGCVGSYSCVVIRTNGVVIKILMLKEGKEVGNLSPLSQSSPVDLSWFRVAASVSSFAKEVNV